MQAEGNVGGDRPMARSIRERPFTIRQTQGSVDHFRKYVRNVTWIRSSQWRLQIVSLNQDQRNVNRQTDTFQDRTALAESQS